MNERPNIVLIQTDQQRYDSLGCYGFEAAHTPNLDRLAADGALFERCYCTNPICTPSRASMFTGRHVQGHGVKKLYDVLPENLVHFPRHLQEAGYATALLGKLHTSARAYENSRRHPTDGFDVYEWCMEQNIDLDSPMNGYAKWLKAKSPEFFARLEKEGRNLKNGPREFHMTHWAAERTIDFIRNRDTDKPFFAYMSVFDPHNPYEDYPPEAGELIDDAKIPDPLITPGEMDNAPRGIRQEHESSYMGDFKNYSKEDLRKMRFGYHASLALLDLEVGEVLQTLRDEGIEENTLVIFTSDHGDMLGDHQLLVKGAYFFDPNVRVPLIVRWPEKIKAGRRVEGLVQHPDLAATILTAAGLDPDDVRAKAPEGTNLVPMAAGKTERIRDYAITSYRNTGIKSGGGYFDPEIHATMIRDDRYKLNVYHNTEDPMAEPEGELYDMNADPLELNNLWDDPDHRETRRGLTDRLMNWMVVQEIRYSVQGDDWSDRKGKPLTTSKQE